jgi:hypothetical protein
VRVLCAARSFFTLRESARKIRLGLGAAVHHAYRRLKVLYIHFFDRSRLTDRCADQSGTNLDVPSRAPSLELPARGASQKLLSARG